MEDEAGAPAISAVIDPATIDAPASPEHAASTEYAAVTLYEHRGWFKYLLPACVPGAARLKVRFGETAEDVLARLDPGCSTFVFHINLTLSARVPLDREALIGGLQARGIATCNAQLTDISKRTLHAVCARAGVASPRAGREGDPEERVVVKTTYNFHGVREAALAVELRQLLGYEAPHDLPRRQDTEYRIVARREVPEPVWTSPHWVVERYIVNSAHRFHRVYVAGDAMVVSRVFDPSTFKKMPEGIPRESFYMTVSAPARAPEVPAEIATVAELCARIVRAGKVDYGAIDVVNDDHGGYYVIDINATPFWGDGGHPTLLAYLGAGLVGERHGG
ncbi:MAG TPA: hypothetical protein VFK02_20510 [Kofleriaceae bacterium]|nr:hypothetical protein [Kofleriaceae bacterium]